MADDGKTLLAFLNGFARMTYFGENDITKEFLKNELYKDIEQNVFDEFFTKCSALVKSMVSADMDFNQLEAFLTSQTRRKESGITDDQANVFKKFWKNQKAKIHVAIISQNTWNNKLKGVSWRIDIRSQARHIEQINTPTAIMELQIEHANQRSDKANDVVRFEMDESKLSSILQSMEDIEEQINKHCQQ